ncbi:Uncharacterized protein APZ42_031901 [Daphnia magna]|uniref:Uncharacterized protein n=1 Tax=Daphnia magna TaxID=35525 RepID=A0A164MCS7_9CRUS|nr:Uncharacterized protein APZ42_031901 [Daphnia magna]
MSSAPSASTGADFGTAAVFTSPTNFRFLFSRFQCQQLVDISSKRFRLIFVLFF